MHKFTPTLGKSMIHKNIRVEDEDALMQPSAQELASAFKRKVSVDDSISHASSSHHESVAGGNNLLA